MPLFTLLLALLPLFLLLLLGEEGEFVLGHARPIKLFPELVHRLDHRLQPKKHGTLDIGQLLIGDVWVPAILTAGHRASKVLISVVGAVQRLLRVEKEIGPRSHLMRLVVLDSGRRRCLRWLRERLLSLGACLEHFDIYLIFVAVLDEDLVGDEQVHIHIHGTAVVGVAIELLLLEELGTAGLEH